MSKNIALTLSLFLAVALLYGCQFGKSEETKDQREPGGQLLLKSGFEEGVKVTDDMNQIVGTDDLGTWDASTSWIKNSRFAYVIGRDKDPRLFMESYIEKGIGPKGNETNILCLKNKADDPDNSATSRTEFSFFGKEPPDDYKEGYVRYWMKLQENLNDLLPTDKETPFYMIMEWKEPNSKIVKSAAECKECCNANAGGTNNYRINVNLRRKANSNEFVWTIRGEHPQPCRKEEWRHENSNVKVPLGEWFLVEGYMKKDATDGRVYFAVNEQVILDTDETRPEGFTGRTTHADNPMHLAFWSPMKNYHGMQWNEQGPVSQWYDDFEMWSSFPPGHSALKSKSIGLK